MARISTYPVLALLASVAGAQEVSPARFATAAGNTSTTAPIGDSRTPLRYLQVHDDMAGRPMTIRALSFRLDEANTSAIAAFNLIADIYMSNAATTAATVATNFDQNHGANKVQCATFAVISLPATNPASRAIP